ncbi:alkylhydroperoxidase [bacterium]|nr:carboxymuconolactone decarboxylase family protein [Chloroflexi bacterium CFX6]RIL11515.1 MAG: alkylhydroperoxidase [bacterium]
MPKLPKRYRDFSASHPDVWQAFEHLGATAAASGPLDERTRELVKLGMAAAGRSRSAVQSHVHRALEAGATPAEVEHAVMVGITTIGFPTMMTALSWVRDAIGDHET